MARGLRLVWSSSSPKRRAPDPTPFGAGSPPDRATLVAHDLVDAWLDTPSDSRAAAVADLVARIAEALKGHACIVLPVVDVAAGEEGPGSR